MPEFPALPFSRWDIRLGKGESGHSFFARLVARQGDNISLRQYTAYNDMDWRKLVPDEVLKEVLKLPLDADTKALLRRYTPEHVGPKRFLAGEEFSSTEFAFRRRRWCTACITEEAYGRTWFDIVSVHTCPYHDIPLVARDASGRSVFWDWPDYADSRHGVPLGGVHMENRLREGTFGHYLLGRLGLEEPMSAPLLDDKPMRHVIMACEAVGLMKKYPTATKAPAWESGAAEIGFPILAGSLADVAEFYRDHIREHNPSLTSMNLDPALLWSRGRLFRAGALKHHVYRAMKAALEAQHRDPEDRITHAEIDDERVTFESCQDQFGINKVGLSGIARALGYVAPEARRPKSLLRADALKCVAFAKTLVNSREAARRLGVIKDAIESLVRAGFLRKFTMVSTKGRLGALFDPAEIDAIVKRVDELPVNGKLSTSRSFHAAVIQKFDIPGPLAVRILKGEVQVAGRRARHRGFASLLLDVGAENGRPMLQADPRLVTKAEAIILMNFRFKTVDRLIELGKLRPKGKSTNLMVFDRKKVLELSRKYVKSSDFYKALGITRYAFRDLMAAKGIRPLPKSADAVHSDTLYVRQEVLDALGLDTDPSRPDDPRLREFWGELKSAIKARIPAMHFPERLSSSTTRASTSSRSCRFAVAHDLEVGAVNIAFEPATAGRYISVELDGRERWPTAIAEVVDIALSREREFKAKAKEKSAERYRGTATRTQGTGAGFRRGGNLPKGMVC